nr:hypothetical protein [Marinobacter sp.]
MSNTGGVHREGSQGHKKHVLVVVCRQVQVAGTGFSVTVFLNRYIQRTDPVTAKLFKGRMDGVFDHCSHSNCPVFN